jgi:transposase
MARTASDYPNEGKALHPLIRAASAKLLFLPKYSPDLNPIERSSPSSNTSCASRRMHRRRRHRSGRLFTAFAPQECANYFKNARYAPA